MQLKPHAQKTMKRNIEALNVFVEEAKKVADIRFDYKSQIHVRITVNGKWVDFWPTTGKWYDPSRNGRGTSVETLINILRMKTGTEKPPHPGLVKSSSPPSILERLAIIDQHINAIRTELRGKEPKSLPNYMADELDELPIFSKIENPAKDPGHVKSYASVSDLIADNDDSPPWAP